MEPIHSLCPKKSLPIRVIQFGEGNFLRGFADYMLDISNGLGITDIGVAIVKPRRGNLAALREQNCVYTVLARGKSGGAETVEKRVISCVMKALGSYDDYGEFMALARLEELQAVISNTTEAGIVLDVNDRFDLCPPESFPGKLAKFLFARWEFFDGDIDRGLVIFPTELIDRAGDKLREYVLGLSALWKLPPGFSAWVEDACIFCNTLVDRIVTGFPAKEAESLWCEWGCRDDLIVACEPYALWVIESPRAGMASSILPLDRAGLPVIFTDDLSPYRERKVRILNGAHTAMAPAAYLFGLDTVGECMRDATVRAYLEKMLDDEIKPCLSLPGGEAEEFAAAVFERFENPFISHGLLSITLNSISKWKTRVLPSLLDYYKIKNAPPPLLSFSFAALLSFYGSIRLSPNGFAGTRGESDYAVSDDNAALEFIASASDRSAGEYVRRAAENTALWGFSLATLEGFCETAEAYLADIRENGMRAAMEALLGESGGLGRG